MTTPDDVPPLPADPAGIRAFAEELLAASIRLDEVGRCAGADRGTGDWRGATADAYRCSARRTGSWAEALARLLREVAGRVAAHAAAVQVLLARRADLVAERGAVLWLLGTPGQDCRVRLCALEAAVAGWTRDVAEEEAAMRSVLEGEGLPEAIGNTDGVPVGARDAANRIALADDLARWEATAAQRSLGGRESRLLENARAAQAALDGLADDRDPVTGRPVATRLYAYDPDAFDGEGAVAVAIGPLESADHVAVVVPGFGTDAESAPYQSERALRLYEASRHLEPDETTATLAWIGYDAPDDLPWREGWDAAGVVGEPMAAAGGGLLAAAVGGLRDARAGEPAHLTVIGYSYGSTTLGHAAHDHGLPADDLVLVGSPGVGSEIDHAADLGLDAPARLGRREQPGPDRRPRQPRLVAPGVHPGCRPR